MKQFIKEKYNILIPVFLGVVILIALFLYGREYRNNRYAYEKEQDVYQYFSKNKIEYKATILESRQTYWTIYGRNCLIEILQSGLYM